MGIEGTAYLSIPVQSRCRGWPIEGTRHRLEKWLFSDGIPCGSGFGGETAQICLILPLDPCLEHRSRFSVERRFEEGLRWHRLCSFFAAAGERNVCGGGCRHE